MLTAKQGHTIDNIKVVDKKGNEHQLRSYLKASNVDIDPVLAANQNNTAKLVPTKPRNQTQECVLNTSDSLTISDDDNDDDNAAAHNNTVVPSTADYSQEYLSISGESSGPSDDEAAAFETTVTHIPPTATEDSPIRINARTTNEETLAKEPISPCMDRHVGNSATKKTTLLDRSQTLLKAALSLSFLNNPAEDGKTPNLPEHENSALSPNQTPEKTVKPTPVNTPQVSDDTEQLPSTPKARSFKTPHKLLKFAAKQKASPHTHRGQATNRSEWAYMNKLGSIEANLISALEGIQENIARLDPKPMKEDIITKKLNCLQDAVNKKFSQLESGHKDLKEQLRVILSATQTPKPVCREAETQTPKPVCREVDTQTSIVCLKIDMATQITVGEPEPQAPKPATSESPKFNFTTLDAMEKRGPHTPGPESRNTDEKVTPANSIPEAMDATSLGPSISDPNLKTTAANTTMPKAPEAQTGQPSYPTNIPKTGPSADETNNSSSSSAAGSQEARKEASSSPSSSSAAGSHEATDPQPPPLMNIRTQVPKSLQHPNMTSKGLEYDVVLIGNSNVRNIRPTQLHPQLKTHIVTLRNKSMYGASRLVQNMSVSPKSVVFHIGVNEMQYNDDDTIIKNLGTLIDTCQATLKIPPKNIIITSIPKKHCDNSTQTLNDKIQIECHRKDCQFINLNTSQSDFQNEVHFNANGTECFLNTVSATVIKTLNVNIQPRPTSVDNSREDTIYFSGEDHILSNFFPMELSVDGMVFPTAEHLFQYQMAVHKGYHTLATNIRWARTAQDAKGLAKVLPKDRQLQVAVMSDIITLKCEQNHAFRDFLKNSNGRTLIENTPDPFWGKKPWNQGNNMLGKLLMDTRSKLINNSLPPKLTLSKPNHRYQPSLNHGRPHLTNHAALEPTAPSRQPESRPAQSMPPNTLASPPNQGAQHNSSSGFIQQDPHTTVTSTWAPTAPSHWPQFEHQSPCNPPVMSSQHGHTMFSQPALWNNYPISHTIPQPPINNIWAWPSNSYPQMTY
jgi:ribA/ribD-fused uncharacterized protein